MVIGSNGKTPGTAIPGVFYAVAVMLSVQPLANIVCDYTCCDRYNKRDKYSGHRMSPPSE